MRFLAIVLMLCGSVAAQAAPGFGYMLNCSGELRKFDVATSREVGHVMLSDKSKLVPAHGDRGSSEVDGCAAYGGVYQAATHRLYTVVPQSGSEGAGNRQFRVLGFQLPEVKLVESVEIPDSFAGGEAPVLTEDAGGAPVLSETSHRLRLLGEKLGAWNGNVGELPGESAGTSTMPATLDLSAYRLAPGWTYPGKTLPFTALESAGDKVLISYRSPALSFAVVDRQAKVLTQLRLPFESAEGSVHLVPGGGAAFAQEAHPTGGAGLVKTSVRLALMDSAMGTVRKAFSAPVVGGMYSLAVLANGRVLFYRGSSIRFFASGASFAGAAVQGLAGGITPVFFLADQ